MLESIEISGNDGKILIQVTSYERGHATNEDDANWLRSELTVSVGSFTGRFCCAITTFDLARFAEELKVALATLSGRVPFHTSEGDIDLEIAFAARGTATIRGMLKPQESLQASMEFTIDSDQSYLARTLHQLGAALRKFPIRQAGRA